MGRRRRRTHLYVGADLLANRIIGISVRKFVRRVIVPITIVTGATVLGRHRSYFLYAYRIFEIGRHVDALYLYFLITGWFAESKTKEKSRFKSHHAQ